jgi:15-cis-phytoene synthase
VSAGTFMAPMLAAAVANPIEQLGVPVASRTVLGMRTADLLLVLGVFERARPENQFREGGRARGRDDPQTQEAPQTPPRPSRAQPDAGGSRRVAARAVQWRAPPRRIVTAAGTAVSETITRKSASNLALAFVLLPPEKRRGMSALYAFCREVDDIADDETRPVAERRARLQAWREDAARACAGEAPVFPVNRELQPFIRERRMPFSLFDELIQGVEMDLDIRRYETMEELGQYCYRVASVVGLLSIEIFRYQNPRCREYAVHLGKALQLTNILRDVRNDAERGRIYLPREEMARFGVTEAEIMAGEYSERYFALARSIGAAARAHYAQARASLPAEDRPAMATAELMGSVYWRLLQKLERRRYDVFGRGETRLSKAQKLFLILRMWYRLWRGNRAPNYGVG